MKFFVADTFSKAMCKLDPQDRRSVEKTVRELEEDMTSPGLRLHPIEKNPDPGFRSARVNQDMRLILHIKGDSVLLCYASHHDKAYQWAEKRTIEDHPKTGALRSGEPQSGSAARSKAARQFNEASAGVAQWRKDVKHWIKTGLNVTDAPQPPLKYQELQALKARKNQLSPS